MGCRRSHLTKSFRQISAMSFLYHIPFLLQSVFFYSFESCNCLSFVTTFKKTKQLKYLSRSILRSVFRMPNTVQPQTEYPYQVYYKIDPSPDKKSASRTFENFAIYRFLIIPHENCLTRKTAKSTPLPLLSRLPKFQGFTSEPPVGGIFKRDLRLCIISLEQNRMDKQGEMNHLYF